LWFFGFFFLLVLYYLCFYIAGLALCAHSWQGKHRYFEVLRSYVFQLRSIHFRRPLHHTLHTIEFLACSPSIQCQLLFLQILAPERALHATKFDAMQADLHLKQPLAPVPRSGYTVTVNL
jgi:hypothetical protein